MSGTTTPLAYLNGALIPGPSAAIPVWDRGVVQGATVTEMIRTFRRVPFLWAEHLVRLRSSLDYLGVQIRESDAELSDIAQRLLESRWPSLTDAESRGKSPEQGLVIFVTPGSIPMYAGDVTPPSGPTVCLHTFRLPEEQWQPKYQAGQALCVPSIRQIPTDILDPRFKYRSRLHWFLADREAHAFDPGAVAILQNQAGFLTETNSGNFFIVRQGRIKTPHERDVLPGISQQFIRELAEELEIPYEVGDITLTDALQADESFVSSTTYCILPVTRLNRQMIGQGLLGPVVRSLLNQWSARVGIDILQTTNQDGRHS